MNQILILSEKIFTIFAFIHYVGSPLILILSGGASEGDLQDDQIDMPIVKQIFLIIYIISFLLLLLRWKQIIPAILKGGWLWLLLGLAICSISWSFSPYLTQTRVVALTGSMMFSLYFASRYTLKEQLYIFGWVFGIGTIASLLFVVLLPKFGIMGGIHAGAWRGIYTHKNGLGRTMLISTIVFLLLALITKKNQWVFWALLGTSFAMLLLSKSSSPLINLLILMSIFFTLQIVRWNYLFLIPALIGLLSVGMIVYLLIATNASQIAGAFGKDLTFTGRTDFWPLMLDKIREKPWLGYGFGAFWQGLDGPSAYVWNASAFKAPNGHNGYLDLCLDLGLVGLTIYSLEFISAMYRAIGYIRSVKTADAFLPILLLCLVILSNLTESSLVLQNNLLWTLQVSTFLSLCLPQLSENSRQVFD
jgi:exopolysaccharide production protein ExoQ